MIFRRSVSALALCLAAACSQGSNIASPGASSPGTPPTGGGSSGGGGGSAATCPTGFTEGAAVGGFTTCNLSGTYLADLTLPFVSGVAYAVDGRVDVGVDVGADGAAAGGTAAVLTIEPGVTVFGRSGADYIVVNRGSQIDADGNTANPIVMTSANDLIRRADSDPANDFGGDNIGEWGGLVILGQAPINRCRNAATPATIACDNVIEGVSNPDAVYGGDDATDNSGTLRYVSLRFSGFAIGSGNELNGISLGGVGSGTTIDYVQVHNSSDDGIEFFGGTVNAKHLVLTGEDDDSLDTDNGYNGSLQYVVVKQRAAGGDNMVEASSVAGITPASNAKVSNFTFIGDAGGNAFRLNTGTVGTYVNGVVKEVTECFRWETSAGNGVAGYQAGVDPAFNSVLFDCAGGLEVAGSDIGAASAALAAGTDNSTATASTLINTFINGAAESAVTAFDVTGLSSDLEPVDYIGAVENATDTWWQGWSCGLEASDPC